MALRSYHATGNPRAAGGRHPRKGQHHGYESGGSPEDTGKKRALESLHLRLPRSCGTFVNDGTIIPPIVTWQNTLIFTHPPEIADFRAKATLLSYPAARQGPPIRSVNARQGRPDAIETPLPVLGSGSARSGAVARGATWSPGRTQHPPHTPTDEPAGCRQRQDNGRDEPPVYPQRRHKLTGEAGYL